MICFYVEHRIGHLPVVYQHAHKMYLGVAVKVVGFLHLVPVESFGSSHFETRTIQLLGITICTTPLPLMLTSMAVA